MSWGEQTERVFDWRSALLAKRRMHADVQQQTKDLVATLNFGTNDSHSREVQACGILCLGSGSS